ncbi:Signal transduction histidine kinase [Chitinophaga sp. CF118]|uniref:sensor histidine kinase n=1 Tax=Chitinophaga sp. CF118 TaxID=1884367 RepID=UPI0008F16C5D|nr:HAMP domain-containing sensor histidine kinase [Chitinophaga sp. CF118]SFD11707.1 Signal transduction histidine kinase [Chitinophaga sp. CF118]
MKLLYKTTRDFLLVTIIIMTIAGVGIYLLLKKEVKDEMNEQLVFQTELAIKQMQKGKPASDPFISITPTTNSLSLKPVYKDTVIFDQVQQENEDYHYLEIVKEINGQHYHIKAMTTYVGWGEYYKTIFYLLLAAIILLAGSGVLINYFSNKKIWKPFCQNLEQLKNYSVSTSTPLQLYDSPITEFKELQAALKDLTERSHREYMALREFTENASHEIQTPLGIIQSKLDRLSQLEVTEEMARYIVQAKSGVERLSKMNKNLLLLAKLDNQIFEDKQTVDLQEVLEQHLYLMEDLFAAKNIEIKTHINKETIIANLYLCDVLISNLFSNVLRYTEQGGHAGILLQSGQLIISNSGNPLDFPSDQLFNRFKKSNNAVQSNGLGLAIVQQICMVSGWNIHYHYLDHTHVFSVHF